MSTLLGKDTTKKSAANLPTAQDFFNFFDDKVDAVRPATGGGPRVTELPPAPAVLKLFSPYTIDKIRNVICGAPSKTCALDPIPSHVVKEFLTELLPFITDMCNTWLWDGFLPASQRHAIVEEGSCGSLRRKKTTCRFQT